MEFPTTTTFRIGDWCIDPISGLISRNGESSRVEARTMRLLLCLAEYNGKVVSIDELLNQVWPDVVVSSDSVYQAVTSLRRLLGDDPKNPTYIATVPRLGYRMIATVNPWTESVQTSQPQTSVATIDPVQSPETEQSISLSAATVNAANYGIHRQRGFTGYALKWIGVSALCVILLAIAVAFLTHRKAGTDNQAAIAAVPQQSIAVQPFLDLTEGMKEETFADGMTEELIGRLSKIPGLRVPAPTSSFYFKGKQISVADIAKALGVAYVLDGSVRKSGARLRVAARLVRAENGYVIWSETYDRPFDNILMVQDDIAGEVTKALKASIQATPNR